jgi:serine/threonine protein phosphatase PrpC
MLDVEFAELSDPGRVREHNEDYLGCALPETPTEARTRGWLFVLADGVGGQERGEIASRLAVETVLAGFRETPAHEPHSPLLQRLLQAANAKIYEAGMSGGAHAGSIATTFVACALRYDRAVVAHVGDSRCYLIRHGHARALTRDHTFANEQVSLGLLSARKAAEAPTRHVLSRSLGNDLFAGIEVSENQVFTGDVLLLCSDGLHGAVDGAEMARVVTGGQDLAAAVRELVELANQRDGSDNISVQLIRVRGVERMGMYRGRPYRLR